MAAYDLTMRHLAQEFPADMAFLSLGLPVDEITTLSPDLPAVERRADWLAKVRIGRETGLLQVEFQTEYTEEKKEDSLGYRVQARKLYGVPVLSVMVLLSKHRYPGPGHNRLKEAAFGHVQLVFEYHEVRLWEQDPEVILKSGAVGLIPLVPLMKGRGRAPLEKALAAASAVKDNVRRADVMTAIAVLGSLKYPKDLIKSLIGRENMKESPIYREIFEEGQAEGRKQGEAEGRKRWQAEGRKQGQVEGRKQGQVEGRKQGQVEGLRQFIRRTLQERFDVVPAKVGARLGRIGSFERLEDLAKQAVRCPNLVAFSKLLD